MKNQIICFLLVVNSSILFSQVKQTEVNTVVKNMKTQELAWNEADIAGFMKYYWNSDSLKFIGSKGITYGWQKTYDNYMKGYPNKGSYGDFNIYNLKKQLNYLKLVFM
jgi:hypothetical protein